MPKKGEKGAFGLGQEKARKEKIAFASAVKWQFVSEEEEQEKRRSPPPSAFALKRKKENFRIWGNSRSPVEITEEKKLSLSVRLSKLFRFSSEKWRKKVFS